MNRFNLSGIDKAVIVRGLLMIIAMINIILGYLGKHLISMTDSDAKILVDGLIVLATVIIWVWGWWKNNSFTLNAQTADEVLDDLNKEG